MRIWKPGERFLYGFSVDLLGAVIETASGVDLDTFLRTRNLDLQDEFRALVYQAIVR